MPIDPFLLYPLPGQVCPEALMWRRLRPGTWVRSDGAVLGRVVGAGVGWALEHDGDHHLKPVKAGLTEDDLPVERRRELVIGYADSDAMRHVDRFWPASVPLPLVRQVWFSEMGYSFEVLAVVHAPPAQVVVMSIDDTGRFAPVGVPIENWPPEGCIMVADVRGPVVWHPEGWERPTMEA